MKVFLKIFFVILFSIYLCSTTSCKKKSPVETEPPEPVGDTLWVEVSENVLGYPETGVTVYLTPDTIGYLYSPKLANTNFMVTLDGVQIPDSGYFVMNQNHRLVAMCENKVIWKLALQKQVYYSCPAVAENGTIYISTGIFRYTDWGTLYAVNPGGTVIWSYDCEYNPYTPVIGRDGTVFIQDFHNQVYAVGPDGNLKWKFTDFDAPVHIWYDMGQRIPAVASDGTVYIAADGLYALDPGTGERIWRFNPLFSKCCRQSPVVGPDGTVYIFIHQYDFYAVNPDGTEKWHAHLDNEEEMTFTCPAIDENGMLYFGSETEHFYALNPDGTLKWKTHLAHGMNWSSAAICDDGTLYIGTQALTVEEDPMNGGNLYAIRTESMGYAASPWPRFRQNHKNNGRYDGQ